MNRNFINVWYAYNLIGSNIVQNIGSRKHRKLFLFVKNAQFIDITKYITKKKKKKLIETISSVR